MSLKKYFQLQVMAALAVMLVFVVGCGEGEDDAEGNDDTASDSSEDTGTDTDEDTSEDTGTDTGSEEEPVGTDDPTDTPLMTFTFDSSLQGWEIGWTEPEGDTDFAATVEFTHVADDGDPDNGAAQIYFEPAGPDFKVQANVNLEPAVDLSGRTITARVKLVEGLTDDPSAPGGAMLFLKSTNGWIWANGAWYSLDVETGWTTVAFEVDYPDFINPDVEDTDGTVIYEFDITQVKQIGLHVSTASAEIDTDFSFLPTTVVFDSVSF